MMDRSPDVRETVEPERPIEAPERPREPEALSRERQTLELDGYRYQVSPAQQAMLTDIGRFRTIALEDLERVRYPRQARSFKEDLQSLSDQGLAQLRSVSTGPKGQVLKVVVLTKTGKRLLENSPGGRGHDQLYAGLVKPAELRHDAAIYRMFQREAARLEAGGSRIERIVLDYELKQKVYRPLAKAKTLSPAEWARRQAEVARLHQLKVIRGRILLPDLRIEFRTASGEAAHIDLELATHHYRGSHLRGKAEAGFKLYAPQDSVGKLSAAFDPEFAAQIFSF